MLGLTVDLAKVQVLASVLHVVEQGSRSVCGNDLDLGTLVQDVDANAVSVKGIRVCGNCRRLYHEGGTMQNDETIHGASDGNDDEAALAVAEVEGEEEVGVAEVTALEQAEAEADAVEPKRASRAKAAPAPKPAAKPKPATKKVGAPKPAAKAPAAKRDTLAAQADALPIGAKGLKDAVARAERAVASQPKRTEATLDDAAKEKAFKLGKAIAADAWLLRKKSDASTPASTVAGIVGRIEARVAERNAIRSGG